MQVSVLKNRCDLDLTIPRLNECNQRIDPFKLYTFV